jgi:hypothetical protein
MVWLWHSGLYAHSIACENVTQIGTVLVSADYADTNWTMSSTLLRSTYTDYYLTMPLCYAGQRDRIPDGHLHRVLYTRWCIDTIDSPDDVHWVAGNMYRSEINRLKKCVNLVINTNCNELHGQQNIKQEFLFAEAWMLLPEHECSSSYSHLRIPGSNYVWSVIKTNIQQTREETNFISTATKAI